MRTCERSGSNKYGVHNLLTLRDKKNIDVYILYLHCPRRTVLQCLAFPSMRCIMAIGFLIIRCISPRHRMQRSYQVCLRNILLDSLPIIIIRPRHNVTSTRFMRPAILPVYLKSVIQSRSRAHAKVSDHVKLAVINTHEKVEVHTKN